MINAHMTLVCLVLPTSALAIWREEGLPIILGGHRWSVNLFLVAKRRALVNAVMKMAIIHIDYWLIVKSALVTLPNHTAGILLIKCIRLWSRFY